MKILFSAMAILAINFQLSVATAQDLPRVVDQDGFPISGAEVMIGISEDVPFPGNVLKTNSTGHIDIPVAWKSSLPVTVEAKGFIRTTVTDIPPGPITINLEREDGPDKIEVKGNSTNFGRLRSDGKVDFALVVPALDRRQLLGFDLSHVISPEIDTMTIVGRDFNMPSNISIPRQRETYIFPLTFDKPQYRIFVRKPGEYRFIATHGQFPLRKVIDDLRAGKSFFDVLDHFQFIGSGQINTVVPGPISGQDIAVNQVSFSSKRNVTAPNYAANEAMVSIALVEESGRLFPSDLKRIAPSETRSLVVPNDARPKRLLSVLLKEDPKATPVSIIHKLMRNTGLSVFNAFETANEDKDWSVLISVPDMDFQRLSISFENFSEDQTPSFLPFVDKPVVQNSDILLNPPPFTSDIQPLGTYISLSHIEEIKNDQVKTERKTRLWEIFSPAWSSGMELPRVDWTPLPDKNYRWEVIYLGTTKTVGPGTGVFNVDQVTHISRNAVNF